MAVLRAIKGLNPGQLFPLELERAVVGRHPDCDIVLDIGAVSRQHAQILKIGEEFFVEDLHSRNGTYLNEQSVQGRRQLAENDQVRVCDLVFVFHTQRPSNELHGDSIADPTSSGVMIVDDEQPHLSSSVMSKLDVSSGREGLRLTVNTEAKLKALLEIGQNLGATLSFHEVLHRILDSLFSIYIQADRGFVILKTPGTDQLIPKAVKHRREEDGGEIRLSRTVIDGVMIGKEAVLSADAKTDSRFDMAESIVDFHIHSIMCAPLIGSEGQVFGVLQIDTLDPRHRFNHEDLEVLASVACQAAVAVENAQLHEVALQEKVLQRELTVAHQVQRGFLPAASPVLSEYEFFDFYEPANHLGGDYFDYVWLPDGRLAVVLGDVSGKGIAAALLMAKLSAEARYCLVTEPTPAAAIGRLNRVFCESRWEDRFVTLVVGVLDPAVNEVTFVNAGHMPPLLRRTTGQVELVAESIGGLPLGVSDTVEYEQFSMPIALGESLTFYTDGIPDAMNSSEVFFGTERLVDVLRTENDGVGSLGKRILGSVRQFIGSRPQSDDMCMTCFGWVR